MIKIIFFLMLFYKNAISDSLTDVIIKAKSSLLLENEKLKLDINNIDFTSQFSEYLLPSLTIDAGFYYTKPVLENKLNFNNTSLGKAVFILPQTSSTLATYGATINQNLSIYKIIPGIIYLKELYKINKINYDLFSQNLIISIVELYMNIIFLQKSISIYEQKFDIMEKEFKNAQIKKKYGIFNDNQLNLLQSSKDEIKNKVKSAKNQLIYFVNEYKILINEEPNNLEIPMLEKFPFHDKNDFISSVEISSVKLTAVNQNKKIATLEENASIANMLPDIYGIAGYKNLSMFSAQDKFVFNSLYVGLNASFAINSPRNNFVNLYKANKKTKMAILQSKIQKSQILTEAEMLWNNYLINQELLTASNLKIKTLENAVNDLKIKMSYGTSSIMQYLQGENQLLEAELQKINTQKDLTTTYYKILIMAGLIKL